MNTCRVVVGTCTCKLVVVEIESRKCYLAQNTVAFVLKLPMLIKLSAKIIYQFNLMIKPREPN